MKLTKCVTYLSCVVLLLAFSASLQADDLAYQLNGGGGFGHVDLNTGVRHGIPFQDCPLGSPAGCYVGLGASNGVLYTAADTGTTASASINVYEVSLTGGGGSLIAQLPCCATALGSTTSGLYGVGADGNLYSFSAATDTLTLIGPTGVSPVQQQGLSVNSGALYFDSAGNLYTLNTATGAATLIGPMDTTNDVGAMLWEDGTLYGTDAPGDSQKAEIFTINTTTGVATDTGLGGAAGIGGGGLAPDPVPTSTPEPAGLLLMATGLLVLAGLLRRRRAAAARY
ncbi:MAG: PEP-CTERM sorting domain-containing protein [Terriglobia bacterium]